MIMMPYGRCRSSLQLTGTQTSGTPQALTVDGSQAFGKLDGLGEKHDRRYYAITVRPQVFINLVPDHVILHRVYPVAAGRTVVDCDWLYSPEVMGRGTDLSHSVELFHRVNQQDFDAC